MTNGNDLEISIAIHKPSLYELGFLTTDIFHLVLAAELGEHGRGFEIEKFYFNGIGEYRDPSRYDLVKYYEEYHDNFLISKLSLGSIVLALTGLGVAASVIVPSTLFIIDRLQKRKMSAIQFNVRSDNPIAHNFLAHLESSGVDSLEDTFYLVRDYLKHKGVSMTATAHNVYSIVDTTVKRVERTLETVYRVQKKGRF